MDTSRPILVVDDSRVMTSILRKLLHQIGFTDVDEAHEGGAALEQLRRKPYGFLISDWQMEPMSGPQLVQAVRGDPALADTRLILVTAHGQRDDESWLVGADGYLSKPFTAAALRDKIEEVVALSA
jgi:two-component system chemotaxis response regulator CheY